jgi:predicted RNA binding protein YcfA (HicA-like mRNA interferase family)
MMMKRTIEGGTITVPVPDHREVRPGTLGSIITLSRLDPALFEVGA